jgi:hypothetical protein
MLPFQLVLWMAAVGPRLQRRNRHLWLQWALFVESLSLLDILKGGWPGLRRVADFSGGQVSRGLPTESKEVKGCATSHAFLRSGLPDSRHRYLLGRPIRNNTDSEVFVLLFSPVTLDKASYNKSKSRTQTRRGLSISYNPAPAVTCPAEKDAIEPTLEESRL